MVSCLLTQHIRMVVRATSKKPQLANQSHDTTSTYTVPNRCLGHSNVNPKLACNAILVAMHGCAVVSFYKDCIVPKKLSLPWIVLIQKYHYSQNTAIGLILLQ